MAESLAVSAQIPLPTDFAVTWENPGDALQLWTWDRMHFPRPVTPLAETVQLWAMSHGLAVTAEQYRLPIIPRYRAFNGYGYQSVSPCSHDPAMLAERGRQAEAAFQAAVMTIEKTWNEAHLPELQEMIATFRAFDGASASDAALAAHVDWTIARFARAWEIHFQIIFVIFLTKVLFAEAYAKASGSTDEAAAFVLLQGLPNKTVEGNFALWRLSREVREAPSVREALGKGDPDAVFAALASTVEGQAFARRFHDFLDQYGWRGDLLAFDDPTWIEDPRTPLRTLQTYAALPDTASPEGEQARLARERAEAVAALRERLAGAPPEVRGQFEGLLHVAQFTQALGEDHNYYIDQMLVHLSRRAFLQAGKRLVGRDRLASPTDVMFLTGDELSAALTEDNRRALRAIVDERKGQLAHRRAIVPPPAMGTPPPPPPSGVEPSPLEKGLLLFFGGPPQDAGVATEIRGNAGSRGMVTGVAWVAATLEEASGLQAGEILVCPTTAAPWTPLFAVAGGVVTDTGGVLSHCAVVAREFGIPAVVGTHSATAVIKTGQRITVDGTSGLVTLEG